MSLLAIVYQSLILFAGLFVVILTISYASYKIKQKTNPVPVREEILDLQPAFAGETKPVIPKNPYLNQGTHYSKPKKNNEKKESAPQPLRMPRYTKIDVLYEDSANETEPQNYGRHSSGHNCHKTRVALHYDDFGRKKYEHSLDGYDILNYYDDNNEQQFYPFRTRF